MNNIPQLFHSLTKHYQQTRCLKSLSPILKTYHGEDWKKFINYEKGTYTKTLLKQDDRISMYLLYWDGNTKSKIHNHAENGCIYKILKGNFYDKRYDPKNLIQNNQMLLHKNNISYIHNDYDYHSITNILDIPSASLHIYSPPNFKTEYF